MPAYGVGLLQEIRFGDEIVEYLRRIDETLAPFGGRFVVHGGPRTVLEGEDPGDVVVIRFPDAATARAWYDSPAYQAILPLRTEHASSTVFLVDGVDADHAATDVIPG